MPELDTTVVAAADLKLGLALTIAVGPSGMMALYVKPFTVFAGWTLDELERLRLHSVQGLSLTLAMMGSSVFQGGAASWHQDSWRASAYVSISVVTICGSEDEVMSVLFRDMGDSVMMALSTLIGPLFICFVTSRAAAACSWRWESVMRELVIWLSGCAVSQAPVVRLDQLCLGV